MSELEALAEPIHIRLSSGYPFAQLGRLIRQLAPVLELATPANIHLDLDGLVFLSPTAQAVLASAFYRVLHEDLVLPGSSITGPRSGIVEQYLRRMDFFRPLVAEELPEDFKRRTPSGFRPLQHFADEDTGIRVASELKDAVREACGLDEGDFVAHAIHLCLAELTENVLFHADARHGGFAVAQGWRRKSEVEVAIVDMGVGIKGSLTKNPAYADIRSDVDAIERALTPMVTATPGRNTGLGLAVTRALLRRNGGQLVVRSGMGAIHTGASERAEECADGFPGTVVSLVARTDGPFDVRRAWSDIDDAGYRDPDDDEA